MHAHPTQALSDALIIRHHFKHLDKLVIVICGDIIHSRVARSLCELFSLFEAEIRLVGPPTLVPKYFEKAESLRCKYTTNWNKH